MLHLESTLDPSQPVYADAAPQVVLAGMADGAVVILERDREGTMKRGRTFRLPQACDDAGDAADLCPSTVANCRSVIAMVP